MTIFLQTSSLYPSFHIYLVSRFLVTELPFKVKYGVFWISRRQIEVLCVSVISGKRDSCQQFSSFHPENQHQIDLTSPDQIWYLEGNPQGTENSVFVHKFENRIIIFFSEPFCVFFCSTCEKLLQRCVRCGINPTT